MNASKICGEREQIILQELSGIAKRLAEQLGAYEKLKSALSKARKDFSEQRKPVHAIENVIQMLESSGLGVAQQEDLTRLRGALEDFAQHRFAVFLEELRELSSSSEIRFGKSGDDITLGTFLLRWNNKSETISLEFSRAAVAGDLPLDARAIIDFANNYKVRVFDKTPDTNLLAEQILQAIRLAIARAGKSISGDKLRAELPAVYREMIFIRQDPSKSPTKETFVSYPLPQFICELKHLMNSRSQTKHGFSFKLETAVIENTKNEKKSLFLPNDLDKSYGEGSYYQAIVAFGG